MLRSPDLLLNLVIDSVSDDGVNLVDDLLVSVQVELVVVEADDDLRVAAIHSLADGCVDLQVEHLDVTVQHHVLLQLGEELALTVAVVLGTPLVYFTQANLINCLLNYQCEKSYSDY